MATSKQYYKDINLNFDSINPITGDIGSAIDVQAIRNSVKNLIMSPNKRIPFNRHKGVDVNSILFEQNSAIMESQLELYIQDVIDQYEPRVELVGVGIERSGNYLDINIVYEILTLNKRDQVAIKIGTDR